jgi:hypothetical protein
MHPKSPVKSDHVIQRVHEVIKDRINSRGLNPRIIGQKIGVSHQTVRNALFVTTSPEPESTHGIRLQRISALAGWKPETIAGLLSQEILIEDVLSGLYDADAPKLEAVRAVQGRKAPRKAAGKAPGKALALASSAALTSAQEKAPAPSTVDVTVPHGSGPIAKAVRADRVREVALQQEVHQLRTLVDALCAELGVNPAQIIAKAN